MASLIAGTKLESEYPDVVEIGQQVVEGESAKQASGGPLEEFVLLIEEQDDRTRLGFARGVGHKTALIPPAKLSVEEAARAGTAAKERQIRETAVSE